MNTSKRWKTFALTALLGCILLGLSYLRIIGDSFSAAFGGKIIDAAVTGPVWGTKLGNNLLIFALTQFFVHWAYALVCWGLAVLSRFAWPASKHSERVWLLFWFAVGALWLLIANAALYAWSSLGREYFEIARSGWHGVSLYSAYTLALVAGLGSLVIACAKRVRPAASKLGRVPAVACTMVLAACGIGFAFASHGKAAKLQKPHVILIGLDSLRADAVENGSNDTPHLDRFLHSAVRFTDATTALARTFPSWVSIISGKHPHTTGAVINLLPRNRIHTGDTLPSLLSKAGYQSIYAIDEVRFSNLDTSYGFDRMISPPIGATDFMLGFFGDAPLSNLLANTRLGELLFPYLHANRAIAHIYDPDTFVQRLERNVDFDKPTFLAVHFTLAHWPYYWADAATSLRGTEETEGTARKFYDAAVRRLDRQFGDFMAALERRGALENAIVMVISDHGESLGRIDLAMQARKSPIGVEFEEDYLVGHGTSVFSPHQYKVVFAAQSYGNSIIPAERRRIDLPVSLLDLTPTVLDLMHVSTHSKFDGISLAPLLTNTARMPALNGRIRFTETEFNPKGFIPGAVISASAMRKAAAYYRVDPHSDRVQVRPELLHEIMDQRQYAALAGEKMLAWVPVMTANGLTHRIVFVEGNRDPVLIPSPETSSDHDVQSLWRALQRRLPDTELSESRAMVASSTGSVSHATTQAVANIN